MNAAKIIKLAQADGVNIALSPVGTLKISGDPANVSRWVPVVKSHKSEIVETLTDLELTRSDFLTHKGPCDAMAAVHGADIVDGPPDRPGQPERLAATESANGYRIVVTAHTRTAAWRAARDEYHCHLMTCTTCKPSWVCKDGRQLKREYELITQHTQSG